MANIALVNNWVAGIYQWADGDVLDGGPDSLEVLPVKQLANNSLHQRLVNVTDWSDTLAAAYGYPLGAVVRHAGVSWRAKLANDVPPGTDPLKWERWGFSESELAAWLEARYLRVGVVSASTQVALAGGSLITIATLTAPRTGRVDIEYQFQGLGANDACSAGFIVHVNGVATRAHDEAIGTTTNLLRITGQRILKNVDVLEGQAVELLVGCSGSNYTKSRAAINLEYRT
jgi:hypothetical protein